MATKKNSASSKTAHVLNVISSPGESGSEEVAERQELGVETAPRHPTPPILDQAKLNDEALAEQIRAAMEDELAPAPAKRESKPTPAAKAAPEPAPPAEPAGGAETPSPAPSVHDQPADLQPLEVEQAEKKAIPQLLELASTVPAPAPVEDPVPSPPPVITSASSDGDLAYVNVMQALVEEKADRYIRMFGMCTCPRCVTDVKALALSNLPAKYVVMRKGEMVPMLTVYEGRYEAAISAKLIHACKSVMDFPRHDRNGYSGDGK